MNSDFDPQMKELVCDVGAAHIRVLYIFDPRQVALLLLGGDKAGDWKEWYRRNMPAADELYKHHLEQLTKEGLI